MTDGAAETVQTTLIVSSAHAGSLRNGAHELAGIALGPNDVAPLAAFLRSLDEDYR